MLEKLPKVKHLESGNFFLIAGPCVIENKEMPFEIAETILALSNKYSIPFIFKASYRKANRSSLGSFTGIGDAEGLEIIKKVGEQFDIPVLTDIHSPEEAEAAAACADVLQIPAFLCRQTELLLAAGNTGKFVNIKKGQFMSPGAMKFAVEKVRQTGNQNIMLTERGTTFGYQDLVVDFRGIPVMQNDSKVPVVLDVTHSLQQPNQTSGVTGGMPGMIETIAKAGIAAGVNGIFIETHPDPANALSDGANMLQLDLLDNLLEKLLRVHKAVQE